MERSFNYESRSVTLSRRGDRPVPFCIKLFLAQWPAVLLIIHIEYMKRSDVVNCAK